MVQGPKIFWNSDLNRFTNPSYSHHRCRSGPCRSVFVAKPTTNVKWKNISWQYLQYLLSHLIVISWKAVRKITIYVAYEFYESYYEMIECAA